MLVLAPAEIKQRQLHLEASRWKSQDGWASSPSSSYPRTLRASLFGGTHVEVLGVPWRATCLDFFHPLVVHSLWLVIMFLQGWQSTCMLHIHTSGGREACFCTKRNMPELDLFLRVTTFCMDRHTKKAIVNILFLYSDYSYVVLYFLLCFLSFCPYCPPCFFSPALTGDCHHSRLPASFLICFTYAFPLLFSPSSFHCHLEKEED